MGDLTVRRLRRTLSVNAAPIKTTPTEAVTHSGTANRWSMDNSKIMASAPIAQCAPCSRYTYRSSVSCRTR
ncbi:Uncharacterised protein [Mycobacterium tuberculosis]|nr:Uncharacterised protein [Mycobacterium tuberculosis]